MRITGTEAFTTDCSGGPRAASAEAPWRQHPATEKQTALLRKLGLAARAGLTKGEAADLLTAVLGDWG